jgi:hypothetical protein
MSPRHRRAFLALAALLGLAAARARAQAPPWGLTLETSPAPTSVKARPMADGSIRLSGPFGAPGDPEWGLWMTHLLEDGTPRRQRAVVVEGRGPGEAWTDEDTGDACAIFEGDIVVRLSMTGLPIWAERLSREPVIARPTRDGGCIVATHAADGSASVTRLDAAGAPDWDIPFPLVPDHGPDAHVSVTGLVTMSDGTIIVARYEYQNPFGNGGSMDAFTPAGTSLGPGPARWATLDEAGDTVTVSWHARPYDYAWVGVPGSDWGLHFTRYAWVSPGVQSAEAFGPLVVTRGWAMDSLATQPSVRRGSASTSTASSLATARSSPRRSWMAPCASPAAVSKAFR